MYWFNSSPIAKEIQQTEEGSHLEHLCQLTPTGNGCSSTTEVAYPYRQLALAALKGRRHHGR